MKSIILKKHRITIAMVTLCNKRPHSLYKRMHFRYVQARRAEAKRDAESMIRNERIALALNMVGMAAYVALFVSIIIVIVVMEGHIIMAYDPSS